MDDEERRRPRPAVRRRRGLSRVRPRGGVHWIQIPPEPRHGSVNGVLRHCPRRGVGDDRRGGHAVRRNRLPHQCTVLGRRRVAGFRRRHVGPRPQGALLLRALNWRGGGEVPRLAGGAGPRADPRGEGEEESAHRIVPRHGGLLAVGRQRPEPPLQLAACGGNPAPGREADRRRDEVARHGPRACQRVQRTLPRRRRVPVAPGISRRHLRLPARHVPPGTPPGGESVQLRARRALPADCGGRCADQSGREAGGRVVDTGPRREDAPDAGAVRRDGARDVPQVHRARGGRRGLHLPPHGRAGVRRTCGVLLEDPPVHARRGAGVPARGAPLPGGRPCPRDRRGGGEREPSRLVPLRRGTSVSAAPVPQGTLLALQGPGALRRRDSPAHAHPHAQPEVPHPALGAGVPRLRRELLLLGGHHLHVSAARAAEGSLLPPLRHPAHLLHERLHVGPPQEGRGDLLHTRERGGARDDVFSHDFLRVAHARPSRAAHHLRERAQRDR